MAEWWLQLNFTVVAVGDGTELEEQTEEDRDSVHLIAPHLLFL